MNQNPSKLTYNVLPPNKDWVYYRKKGNHHFFYPESSGIRYTRAGLIVLNHPDYPGSSVLHRGADETKKDYERRILSLIEQGFYVINGKISERVMQILRSNITLSR